MRTCEFCGRQVEANVLRCPHCLRWSEEALVDLLRHPDAAVRANAASCAIFVEWTERLIRALGVALRDSVTTVRQDAGVALFVCGGKAEVAIPELIEALSDSDVKVRTLAAASLSMVGPPARAALPNLAQLRDTDDDLLRGWVAEAERSLAER